MANPTGSDGAPMERHHTARHAGKTVLMDQCVHRAIHAQETAAIQQVMRQDGLKGNPTAWSAKPVDSK